MSGIKISPSGTDQSYRQKDARYFNPEMQMDSELDFDYFPDIAKDEISVNNIKHDEQSAREEVERQERLNKALEATSRSRSSRGSENGVPAAAVAAVIIVMLLLALAGVYLFVL